MSDKKNLNENGNHEGQFSQGVGGWAEYTVFMTATDDTTRHDVTVPPGKVIPVIFLPGVMGSNLRMSKVRQDELKRPDNRAWRPEDLGAVDVMTGSDYGGWFKNASPAQRQLVFDPTETEVEYYHYTESNDRFDPQGKETLAADARAKNVPDGLNPIPPLLGRYISFSSVAESTEFARTHKNHHTPAQIARWRGWSEVLFEGPYGEMLKTAETFLNNILYTENRPWKGKPTGYWQAHPVMPGTTQPVSMMGWKINPYLMGDPKSFCASSGETIAESDLVKIAPCWYPVHAMGYNFIKSNGQSAKIIAERIRGLVKGYQKRGFKCNEIILVTHSMGGLLSRALMHPDYGNLMNDPEIKLLGVYHNVMPTLGAAAAYKRMRFGFQEEGGGPAAHYQEKVLGQNGQHATAILANAPAPMEMLPASGYGMEWLKVVDVANKTLWSWPREKGTTLNDIYLKPAGAWWRLINPAWVNPGNVPPAKGGGVKNVYKRLEDATKFLDSIQNTFHPTRSYASFCASPNHLTYGEIVFQVIKGGVDAKGQPIPLPPPESWVLLTDDKIRTLTVQAGSQVLTLKLLKVNAVGDETVPAERSAKHIKGTLFVHGQKGKGYEHQNSYADPQVMASMLYSIVQIAKTAQWT